MRGVRLADIGKYLQSLAACEHGGECALEIVVSAGSDILEGA